MDEACLAHRLTDAEAAAFARDGYFVLPGVLDGATIARLTPVLDRIDANYRRAQRTGPGTRLSIIDVIGADPAMLELLDHPRVIVRVLEILGWNVALYHSHIVMTPPTPPDERAGPRKGWHQDTGLVNVDLESDPRPRLSLKVAWFLTDTHDRDDCGNLFVVPGSHLLNRLDLPDDDALDHPRATAVRAAAGDVVFFDRRLWHSASDNLSERWRKVIFYGYAYRWLKPRDDMTVGHYLKHADPIRRQLLGVSYTGGFGFTSPSEVDVPLKAWMAERGIDKRGI